MLKLIMAIAFLLFMIVIGPFLTIWAVNTLFPIAAIPYTWETWIAVILVGAFIRAKVSVNR
jgi:hypothetical protein